MSLTASPVGMLAQCPRPGYLHFVFKPDPPARHASVDDVTIDAAPDLEGLIRTKVETWVEQNPLDDAGEVDVTLDAGDPERLAAMKAKGDEDLKRHAAEGDSDWIQALQELVRDILRDNGYWRAQVTIEKSVFATDGDQDHVSLAIQASEGNQYRVGDIQFKGGHVFSSGQLRSQIPLREGEIFDLGRLRKGVENLTKMYDPLGYINFIASPDTEIDEAQQRISVTFELEEDKPFTVGQVEVLGLAGDAFENGLKMRLKTGDPFNPRLVDEFFSDNKGILPPLASQENVQIRQGLVNNTVDVVFDFRSCP